MSAWLLSALTLSLLPAFSMSLAIPRVTALYRYAVKGLSEDVLDSVTFANTGDTFPDDRRYALLQQSRRDRFDGKSWLHKENFLCAFTEPELMATLQSYYRETTAGEKILTIVDRASGDPLFMGNLATEAGRERLGEMMSETSSQDVVCVTASDPSSPQHTFQFGNTSSGFKQRDGDTRTLHIVNAQTVRSLSEKIGIALDPRRFRPNIVIDDVDAWSEFDWVRSKAKLRCINSGLELAVIGKTVRCKGISVDPNDLGHVLDIPELLIKHFPEHGPYLGVYAVVDAPGKLSTGDTFEILI
jgi:uncharacterized protein YcbX